MPYIIQEVKQEGKKGYKVCKKANPEKCFSKKPLPLETAQRQRTAIIISEHTRKPSGGNTSANKANKKPQKK